MNIIMWQPVIAALAAGITESLKKAFLPSKWAGVVSYIIGLCLGLIIAILDEKTAILNGIIGGLVAGAGASGFYSGIKKLKK